MIRFVLDSWPPSSNNAYINTPRGRVLSPQARKWIEETLWIMAGQRNDQRRYFGAESIASTDKIAIAARFYGQWKFKNGRWRQRDLSNAIKLLEDCAAKSLGFDDRHVFSLRADKIEAEDERTEFDVWLRDEIEP